MKTLWKTVKRFDNYEVSNKGQVRNKRTGYILKPYKMHKSSNLLYVMLFKKGVYKNFPVHKLVAKHFERMTKSDTTAYHLNYVQTDNRDINLEGCTVGDATARTRRLNNLRKYRGIHKFPRAKDKKWRAMLCVGKMKVKTVGYYRTRKEAYVAYIKAYQSLFNENPSNQNV